MKTEEATQVPLTTLQQYLWAFYSLKNKYCDIKPSNKSLWGTLAVPRRTQCDLGDLVFWEAALKIETSGRQMDMEQTNIQDKEGAESSERSNLL